jgi:PAS domain S-box-containing protein
MTDLSKYTLETLREARDFVMYRGRQKDDPVSLLFVVEADSPLASVNRSRLEHEYSFADVLEPAWSARPLSFERHNGRATLILEDPGGDLLDGIVGSQIELARFLRIAIGLAAALRQLHRCGLVHKDIKPENIFVNQAGEVRITGLGMASRLLRERQAPAPPEAIAGTFAYMAPEQTGRMNRSIDTRSDLYSAGIVLYELLTGTLPFSASDPMEWIHCHIARKPQSPSERLTGIPDVVESIILKLLAKDSEDRYQTAAGVEADLQKCLIALETHRRIDPFSLGAHDIPAQLLIPEKLYGRKAEVEMLIAAVVAVGTRGETGHIFVSGEAGIGKSSVVNELHKLLVPQHGIFAAGKFDQYHRNIPYATLAQAFQGLIRSLLSKSDAELGRWREALLEALGPNGQLMVNLIPELALIIGEQPPVAELTPQDSQSRFLLVFRRLLGVFARPEHPLVIFLDDMQWLDVATIELLARLVREPEVGHLLLVYAYRDEEVGPTHPMRKLLATVAAARGELIELRLGALALDHVGNLVADALHTERYRAEALAGLIYEKTGGNPFFTTQFLATLASEGLVAFDPGAACWQWDLDRIRAKAITDNVADLVAGRLSGFSDSELRALKQLACLGSRAKIGTVGAVLGSSEEKTRTSLSGAVQAGLVLQSGDFYAFAHDRVQEASYALIPEQQRARAHLQIGRALALTTSPAELEENIFEIVNQFNRGAAIITSVAERQQIASFNLMAGKRAKTATAYVSAVSYLAAGSRLLAEDGWSRHYRLAFDLARHQAHCELLTGDSAAAERRLSALSEHAETVGDKAAVACLRIALYAILDQSDQAVEVGLEYLRHVGLDWSKHPTLEDVRQEVERMWRLLADRPIEHLVNLPRMSDQKSLATMDVLAELRMPARFSDNNLFDLVLLRMTNFSFEYGNCDASAYAYASLNIALMGLGFRDHQLAQRIGKLGYDLVEKSGLSRFKARVYNSFGAFVLPWTQHLPESRVLLRRAFDAAKADGDLTFAVYSCRSLITNLFVSGAPLNEVQSEAEKALAFARTLTRSGQAIDSFIEQLMLVRALRGCTQEDVSPGDPEQDNRAFEEYLNKNSGRLGLVASWYWTHQIQAHFFAQDYAAALAAAAKADVLLRSSRPFLEIVEYHFYAALVRAAICDSVTADEREEHLAALAMHRDEIVTWVEGCPENFANRAALVAAEIARLEFRELDAERSYECAICSAREHGFVQNEGIANELAARFYAARGFETIATTYLRNARTCYLRWGADTQVRRLEQAHPQLRQGRYQSSGIASGAVEHLDLATVVKVMQAISSEIDLKALIEIIMVTALEHAGGDRGLLILSGDDLCVEAEAAAVDGTIRVTLPRARITPEVLPMSILRHVMRTRDSVLLGDVASTGSFAEDDYIRKNCARSILCLPLTKQAVLVGVLYIENSQTSHAFTPVRLAVLKLLVSQAAISLENARLYTELRKTEATLSEAQRLTHTGSFIFNVASGRNVWSEEIYRIYEFQPAPEVSMEMLLSRVHPDDHDRIRRFIADISYDDREYNFEHRLLMPDGTIKTIRIVAHAVRDESGEISLIGTAMDITASKQADERLRKLASLIENSNDFIGYASVEGAVSYLNAAGRRLVGLEYDDDISLFHMRDFHPVEDHQVFLDEIIPILLRHGHWEGERTLRHFKTHTEIPVLQTIFSISEESTDQRTTIATICRDITERKRDIALQRQAGDALRESKARLAEAEQELRVTLDTIPTLAWRSRADGFAEYLNKRWLDYTGISLPAALGWEWQAAIHPDDRRALVEAWLKMLASGKPGDIEARLRRFDGSYRWFLFRTEALRDRSGAIIGWYGTNFDIEDRKQAESALQRSEAYSAEAQKLSKTGSIAWDPANDDHFWSEETYQIMGFDRGIKPSMNMIIQRVHPDDRDHLKQEVNRTAQGAQDYDYEQRLLMPDGQIKHLHVRAHRVKYESGKEEVVGALMDVTAAKRSQEALHAAQVALAHASRVATLGEISASIAHEVNQPLAAIVANGQACLRFLRREAPDLDDVRGAVEWIVKDGNRAGDVIRRVRGLLKKSTTDKTRLDVSSLINEVAALLQRELVAQLVTLQLEFAPAIPPIFADRIQLQQVIINLVMNGVEAMQATTGRPRALLIRLYGNDAGQVVVAIRDSGDGIPHENVGRVFDAFFSTKPGGLGIGLSICRSIIEEHGGRLWASNNSDGPGSTFEFALPTPRTGAT